MLLMTHHSSLLSLLTASLRLPLKSWVVARTQTLLDKPCLPCGSVFMLRKGHAGFEVLLRHARICSSGRTYRSLMLSNFCILWSCSCSKVGSGSYPTAPLLSRGTWQAKAHLHFSALGLHAQNDTSILCCKLL